MYAKFKEVFCIHMFVMGFNCKYRVFANDIYKFNLLLVRECLRYFTPFGKIISKDCSLVPMLQPSAHSGRKVNYISEYPRMASRTQKPFYMLTSYELKISGTCCDSATAVLNVSSKGIHEGRKPSVLVWHKCFVYDGCVCKGKVPAALL
jgi:hypothetical protein